MLTTEDIRDRLEEALTLLDSGVSLDYAKTEDDEFSPMKLAVVAGQLDATIAAATTMLEALRSEIITELERAAASRRKWEQEAANGNS